MSTLDYAALTPQTNWKRFQPNLPDLDDWIIFGGYQQPTSDPLRALVTVDLYDDVRLVTSAGHWLHLSISRARRLPTWSDLIGTRDALGYADRLFVQLIPPKRYWLNMHKYTLHLFSRLDRETVPEALYDQVGATGSEYGQHE